MNEERSKFTNAEVVQIADAFFQGRSCVCPRDRSLLNVEEDGRLGQRTLNLGIYCPRCGTRGYFQGADVARDIEPWEADDRGEIVEQYFAEHRAICPIDRSILKIDESRQSGPRTEILVHCRKCGRSFFSGQVSLGTTNRHGFEARFSEEGLLAEGGMGRVTLVRDRKTGERFVAKEIKPDVVDRNAVARFRREIQLLQGSAHPNVVRIVADYSSSSRPLFVMEYLPGGHLGSLINDSGVPSSRLANLFDDVAAGLGHLHTQGIVHRDLKPKNIFIGADGRARVGDLGMATRVDATRLTTTGVIVGTLHYMAPEQQRGEELTEVADIYPLGLIAYEIVTRRSPYASPVRPQGHGPFWEILWQALEEEPSRRTVAPRQIAAALRDAVAGGGSGPSEGVASDAPTVEVDDE